MSEILALVDPYLMPALVFFMAYRAGRRDGSASALKRLGTEAAKLETDFSLRYHAATTRRESAVYQAATESFKAIRKYCRP